jgi:hypothetical protein
MRRREFVLALGSAAAFPLAARQWVKKQEDWKWQEIVTGHDAMVTAPAELAHMLAAIG